MIIFIVGIGIMETVSVKIKTHSKDNETRADQKGRAEGSDEKAKSNSFLKIFEKFSGQQAQSVLSGAVNFDLISQIKPQQEIVEKPVQEEEKLDAKVDEKFSEENTQDDNQEVVVDEKNKKDDQQEVVVKQNNGEVKKEKPQEAIENSATVIAQAKEQVQNTQEVLVSDKQIKEDNQALKFELNKQNLEQKATANQKAANDNGSIKQQSEAIIEQAPKAQVGEIDKVKQQFAKISEESAKIEKKAEDKTIDPAAVKIEAAVEVKPQQLVDRNKVSQAVENVALRNPVVQAAISEALSHNSNVNSTDVNAKTVQSISGVNAANEKNVIKKSLGTTTSELPKTQQDKVIEKLQQMIETAAKGRNANTMVVRLDPPQLGQMVVKIQSRGDQIFARIIPESADVEAALRSRVAEIVNVLENSGFKADNIHVSFGKTPGESEMSLFGQMMGNKNAQTESNSQEHSTGANNASNMTGLKKVKKDNYEQTGWIA